MWSDRGSNKTLRLSRALQYFMYLLFKVSAFSTNTSYQREAATNSSRTLAVTSSRLMVKLTSGDLPSRITVR